MNILNPLKFAYIGLKTNKVRSILTMIGIIIGITAVIVVMSAGEGIKGFVLNQLEMFGSNYIQVEVKTPATSQQSTENAMSMAMGAVVTSMKIDDVEDVKKLSNIRDAYGATFGQDFVSYGSERKRAMLYGVGASFIEIDTSEVEYGRFFNEEEDNSLARVTVIGKDLKETLFGDEDAIDKYVKIGKQKYRVIGVLEEVGGTLGFNMDEMAIMPVQTLQKRILGIDYITWFLADIYDQSQAELTKLQIEDIMRENHDISDPYRDDFAVTTMEEARDMIDTIFGGISLLLIAIAAISLVVGGIGIMNIMYVSVTERTYEIGLRKAIGATRSNILWQFLWEAVFITFVGGIFGIVLGIGISYLVAVIAATQGFEWRFVIKISALILAAGFCIGVGLLFGLYPARKAAKMNPIVALRNE